MAQKISKNIRLGIMVLAGISLLFIAMYVVGDKQNLFGSNFRISAYFKNVNGLMVGNNVRFVGINIGTVKSIEIINDSTVKVDMIIDSESQKFIKKNTIASIGTDGLMGNKLVNLNSSSMPGLPVEEGDILVSTQPLDTDNLIKTLSQTNEDIAVIATNLRLFTSNMNSSNSVWSVLTDSTIALNIKESIANIKITSAYSALIANDLSRIISDVKSGNGLVGELLTDTIFFTSLNKAMMNIQLVSDSLIYFAEDLNLISDQILNGDAAITTLLSDSTFNKNLTETMVNVKNGTEGLDEIMEALKHNILLRNYYKKKAKELEKQNK